MKMSDFNENIQTTGTQEPEVFDYSFVDSTARIAVYDDMRSAPRIIIIESAPTNAFIENLASTIYSHSQSKGGQIPYTVIREVSENFIHARFEEIVVSIMDQGNTIRFSDQGPGISQKEKAQLPGFTSATEPMKQYIRGVGSGFPIVKEYLNFSQGSITIDDNLDKGAVITISLNTDQAASNQKPSTNQATHISQSLIPQLNPRERIILKLFQDEGALGVTDISKLSSIPVATVHGDLTKLEQKGLIESTAGRKRILTDFGYKVALSLS